MFGFLLAIHIVVTILLLLIILIQKSEGGSSLFSSGSGTSMFNARGTSSMLTKATWGLATIFLANCILMAHISANRVKASSTIITGTPHVSRPLSNKAVSDLNANKDKDINVTDKKNSDKRKENKSKVENTNKNIEKESTKKEEIKSKENNTKQEVSKESASKVETDSKAENKNANNIVKTENNSKKEKDDNKSKKD